MGDVHAALGRGLEIGALAATWVERHPRWLTRVAAALEVDPHTLARLMVLMITVRHTLPRAVFEWAASREGWVTIEGAGPGEGLRELIEPWWRAFWSPLHLAGHEGVDELMTPEEHGRVVAWLRGLTSILGPIHVVPPAELETSRVLVPSAWAVSGLGLLAEGLAGHRRLTEPIERLPALWEALRAEAVPTLARGGYLPAAPLGAPPLGELFPHVTAPTPMQALALETPVEPGPQLYLLEEASACGKTEAAILLAHRLVAAGAGETIHLVLPWTAAPRAAQQRALDVQPLLFEPDARSTLPTRFRSRDAIHDAEDERDPARALLDAFLADPKRRSLWTPVGGETLDQALQAVLPSRYVGLRQLALSRGVLVVDQLQPSDAQGLRYLSALLDLHAGMGGSSIVLSTAIPREARARLFSPYLRGASARRSIDRGLYPRFTRVSFSGIAEEIVDPAQPERAGLRFELIEHESAALRRAVDAVAAGRAVCWVRNSVEAAIVAYAHAIRELGPDIVIIAHERFTMGDRLDIERVLSSRFGPDGGAADRTGWLVIATSTIDSRDLDFDLMVTDLAPLDVLLDRGGRVHRHPRLESGEPTRGPDQRGPRTLVVIAPPWSDDPSPTWLIDHLPESAGAYPEHGTLWLTMRALRELTDPYFPEDAHGLLEKVYGEDAIEAIPHSLWQSKERLGVAARSELDELRSVALNAMPPPLGGAVVRNTFSAPSRHGPELTTLRLARTVGGVVMPLYASPSGGWELSELNVPSSWIAQRITEGMEAEIATAEALMPDRGRYVVTLVLSWDPTHEQWWGVALGAHGQPLELVYRNDVGLVGR